MRPRYRGADERLPITVLFDDYDACMRVWKNHHAELTQQEADILAYIAGVYASGHDEKGAIGVSVKTLHKAHTIVRRFEILV